MQKNTMNHFDELKSLLSAKSLLQLEAEAIQKQKERNALNKKHLIQQANEMLQRLDGFVNVGLSVTQLQVWQIQCLAEIANCYAKRHAKNLEMQHFYYEVKEVLLNYTLVYFPKNMHVSSSFGMLELSIFTEQAGVSCFHMPNSPEEKFDKSQYSPEIHFFEWEWSGIFRQHAAVQLWNNPRLRALIARATQPEKKLSKYTKKRLNKLLAKAQQREEAISHSEFLTA